MTAPGGYISLYKFIRKVSGNNTIYYFVEHKQPVVSSTLEETTAILVWRSCRWHLPNGISYSVHDVQPCSGPDFDLVNVCLSKWIPRNRHLLLYGPVVFVDYV